MRPPPQGIDTETPATEFPKHWVTKPEALRLTHRTMHTLWRWQRHGLIHRRVRAGKAVWETSELLRALEINAESSRKARFRPGTEYAGPGRPRHPKRAEIATLLTEGHSVGQIMTRIGCSRTLVRNVRTELAAQQSDKSTPKATAIE